MRFPIGGWTGKHTRALSRAVLGLGIALAALSCASRRAAGSVTSARGVRDPANVSAPEGSSTAVSAAPRSVPSPDGVPRASIPTARLPLQLVAEVELPGRTTRFDYQDIDAELGRLFVAHMGDGEVLALDLRDGSPLARLKGVPTARGIAVAMEAGSVFATSSPNQLIVIDRHSLAEVLRVRTGRGPDGVSWDALHRIVGVSDQADGALSLIADAGRGARVQVKLGRETGNVAFDATRGAFWITAILGSAKPDQLIAIDPTSGQRMQAIALAGCEGAHGLRLHPDGASALIACEANDVLVRVELEGSHALTLAKTGRGPDVLAIDPGLGWLYVAAESADVTLFDLKRPGLVLIGHDHPGSGSHSVAVDPATHRVFFPIASGARGTPVLKIMRPSGLDGDSAQR